MMNKEIYLIQYADWSDNPLEIIGDNPEQVDTWLKEGRLEDGDKIYKCQLLFVVKETVLTELIKINND